MPNVDGWCFIFTTQHSTEPYQLFYKTRLCLSNINKEEPASIYSGLIRTRYTQEVTINYGRIIIIVSKMCISTSLCDSHTVVSSFIQVMLNNSHNICFLESVSVYVLFYAYTRCFNCSNIAIIRRLLRPRCCRYKVC